MVGVPAKIPVTTPLEFTVANDGLLLLHVPDGVPSLNVVVRPTHTLVVPVIAAGFGLTVML